MKIEEKIINNILKVSITLPIAEYLSDKKIKISTKEVLEILNEKNDYKIENIIKHGKTITNFIKNKNDTNSSFWVFSIGLDKKDSHEKSKNETRKKTTTTRRATKAPAQPKSSNQKSTGTKTSFRGRMNKIAKDIETRNND